MIVIILFNLLVIYFLQQEFNLRLTLSELGLNTHVFILGITGYVINNICL